MASKGKKSSGSPAAKTLPIVTDPEMAERFERELTWCIGQLECMVTSSSTKDKDPPRAALQTLSNPKTSVIRKRQMMQQLFGDYRQKMQNEEQATRKRHNQIRAKKESEIPLASRFVRRVHQNDSDEKPPETFSFQFQIPSTDLNDNLLLHLVDHVVLLEENLSLNDLNAVETFKSTVASSTSTTHQLVQLLPLPVQRQVNEYLNEILNQLVLCTNVNVKSQLPSTISHVIKRLLSNRKEISLKANHYNKQIQAIDELYAKLNNQIHRVFLEQLKMIKANDLNTNQIDTLRDQYQLLLKQMQLRRCQLIRDIYPMETIENLQRMKLDCEEKQHQYDEQIAKIKHFEKIMNNEGSHYQQLLQRYYQLGDELIRAQNALKQLKQKQQENRLL